MCIPRNVIAVPHVHTKSHTYVYTQKHIFFNRISRMGISYIKDGYMILFYTRECSVGCIVQGSREEVDPEPGGIARHEASPPRNHPARGHHTNSDYTAEPYCVV